jgi:hypothetical protein
MGINNQGFRNSIRCLQHPATWVSIAVLLINDHILKNLSPSFLTGKLSDFAGLFFFPFIVALGLSLILANFRLTAKTIGIIAFVSVAIWFILIKTVQPINSLTAQVTLLLGFPSRFMLDSTDVVAISIMFPAWLIWGKYRSIKSVQPAYIALAIGSLAVIASSGREWTVFKVTNLEYYKNGIVYAADRDGWGKFSYPVAKSLDFGATWELDNMQSNIEEKGLPIKLCGHLNPETCYQVDKNEHLQELVNNETWVNVQQLETTPVYDLILFEDDGTEIVIVANGEYGIWRRELPNGDWAKISILHANQ